jgi:DNA-binding GntR family transcriptional regulator
VKDARDDATALAAAMGRLTAPRTLTDRAYQALRGDIIGGALEPEAKLRVEHLRKRYELGATPIREALSRLAAEGLVRGVGQRGFWVAPISVEDLEDVTDMRVLLETHAVRLSIERGDDAWEARVVAAHHQLAKVEAAVREDPDEVFPEWERRNREFHDALIAAVPSRLLHQFRWSLYDQHERYRRLSIQSAAPRDVAAEHRAIFEATLARDAERACQLTEEHIRRTAENLRRLVSEQQEREEST